MGDVLKGIPIGVSDFGVLIKNGGYFVDKSLFIKEIIDDFSTVKLITRPRRFGKTLNLSMLKYYFEKTEEDNSILFRELKIWQAGERYTKEQGKYPVVAITLKDVKFDSYSNCLEKIKSIMAEEFKRHKYLLESDKIDTFDKKIFEQIVNEEASEVKISESISFLTRLLYLHYREQAIVLIDEYDTPINYGFLQGYYEKIINFMKIFLGSALKDNSSLKMGVITGIYRVAKESIFSGLNNLYTSSVISEAYSDKFGFTENEVEELLKYYKIEHKINEVKSWYNGYIFGRNSVIYNPWSIISYAKDKYFQPYWVNTSSNDLIAEILHKTDAGVKKQLEALIEGKAVPNVIINSDINFRSIIGAKLLDGGILWNFLIVSGYLKVVDVRLKDDGDFICNVKIPNKEILKLYKDIILQWFNPGGMPSGMIPEMLECLTDGKIKKFEESFKYLVSKTFSSFDVGRNAAENFYHAFVLGLLVNLEGKYRVLSSRESGNGRPDIIIIPEDKSKKGVVMEFKIAEKEGSESLKQAVEAGLKQIEEKNYADGLRNSGIKKVIKVSIAFLGKEVGVGYNEAEFDTVKRE